jgi:putative membrane protein
MVIGIITKILIALIALIHCYILWLEMFAWTTRGKKTFKKFPPELFEQTKALAANQGLYNGFLAAGLIWSLLICDPFWHLHVALFFTACVLIAGIYGSITADPKIFYVQAAPAMLAIVLIVLQLYFLHRMASGCHAEDFRH